MTEHNSKQRKSAGVGRGKMVLAGLCGSALALAAIATAQQGGNPLVPGGAVAKIADAATSAVQIENAAKVDVQTGPEGAVVTAHSDPVVGAPSAPGAPVVTATTQSVGAPGAVSTKVAVADPNTVVPSQGPVPTAAEMPLIQNPGLANIRQLVQARDAEIGNGVIARGAENMVTPYIVPEHSSSIYQGSEATFREAAYLRANMSLIDLRTAREAALKNQVDAHRALKFAVEGKKEDGTLIVDLTPKVAVPVMGPNGALPAGVPGGLDALPGLPPASLPVGGLPTAPVVAVTAAPKPVKPPKPPAVVPFVGSIYSFNGKSYAEIFLGGNKVIAEEGTTLLNGDRVTKIGESGVTIRGKKGTKTISVLGSASR